MPHVNFWLSEYDEHDGKFQKVDGRKLRHYNERSPTLRPSRANLRRESVAVGCYRLYPPSPFRYVAIDRTYGVVGQ